MPQHSILCCNLFATCPKRPRTPPSHRASPVRKALQWYWYYVKIDVSICLLRSTAQVIPEAKWGHRHIDRNHVVILVRPVLAWNSRPRTTRLWVGKWEPWKWHVNGKIWEKVLENNELSMDLGCSQKSSDKALFFHNLPHLNGWVHPQWADGRRDLGRLCWSLCWCSYWWCS